MRFFVTDYKIFAKRNLFNKGASMKTALSQSAAGPENLNRAPSLRRSERCGPDSVRGQIQGVMMNHANSTYQKNRFHFSFGQSFHLKRFANQSLSVLSLVAALLISQSPAQSQVTSIVHHFADGSVTNDGKNPTTMTLVKATDGNFYGTTGAGGSFNSGTVFKMTPAGVMTILHHFGSIANDGINPNAGLIQSSDGNFYGTTLIGGSFNKGTIFKITPTGTFTILRHFGSVANDGSYIRSPLVRGTDGNFYGTASGGGSAGYGIIFKMTALGGTFTILWHFGSGTDGRSPYAGLIKGAAGVYYGTTIQGGTSNGGVAFKITSGGVYTILHHFGSIANDGMNPEANLLLAPDGNFYGTTELGGTANCGTILKMTPAGAVTILHSFNNGTVANDGVFPLGGLIYGPDGNFYGTTQVGGSAGHGTIFNLTPSGIVTILHSFGDGSIANDGNSPAGNLVKVINGTDGYLYGTTIVGGSTNFGTVFTIKIPLPPYIVIHRFADGSVSNDGYHSWSGLLLGTDGNFYGTTAAGGSFDHGTVFKISPTGTVTILYHFNVSNGSSPIAPLVIGFDGAFYGTTISGGSHSAGTAFRITPTGSLTTIHHFGGLVGWPWVPDGYFLVSALVPGPGGYYFGVTSAGGSTNQGVAYRVGSGGSYTILHHFGDGSVPNDVILPEGKLLHGPDGNFYGMAWTGGGAFGFGGIYRMTPAGAVTILYSFPSNMSDFWGSPQIGLILGADGNYYGVTSAGGTADYGTAFKITPTGTFTVLHNFGDGSVTNDGLNPRGELLLASNGNFYGTTGGGGSAGSGTIFKMTPAGVVTIHHSFSDGTVADDGFDAITRLVEEPDGYLYGITRQGGGTASGGIVFKILP
jgi:uncharacterized repeat protein (TIGR03803 family)